MTNELKLFTSRVSEKKRKEREKERRDQYKQVQVHVKKDDGRLQAYGWSLPARAAPTAVQKDTPKQSQVPVPVPVYCRPLLEQASGMKVRWALSKFAQHLWKKRGCSNLCSNVLRF